MKNIGFLNIKFYIRIALIFSLISLSSCSDDPTVAMVKNGKLESCTTKSLVEMVDGFLGSPSWSSGITEEKQKFVNIEGMMTVAGKEVKALLQFFVDDETFQYYALEFNGVPQNNLIALGLLSKMCE